MKKLFLAVICLTSFSPSIRASFSFDNCFPQAKSSFFALRKFIKEQFYPEEEMFINHEEYTDAQESLYLARKKMKNKKNYWNKETLILWTEQTASIGDKPFRDAD